MAENGEKWPEIEPIYWVRPKSMFPSFSGLSMKFSRALRVNSPCQSLRLGSAPPRTGLPSPSRPEPRKSPKRVPKEFPGAGVPKECAAVSKESEKTPKI